ncbi:hydrolase [Desulfuromonas versatilis]|uniref:Hydrolase n=1 Tax=Desulfuromonas versatilis TaxID=2802975 RepID=A0ABM8HP58_9BACT|nr:isochorismatase family protein [Desulfuromonas versatilis]BCR04712.1 hydrolase [Desulfuromonas versatilis]
MSQDISRFKLDKDKAALVVVDVQEKLIPAMPEKVYRQTLKSIQFLVEGARHLKLPVVATEQYPKGLGRTVSDLAQACQDKLVEKVSFGCCGEPSFLETLKSLGRSQIIVTGMEAHVCVYQTVLGLLDAGYHVHLVRDAIISRGKIDYLNALENAARAGATVTTAETALFQLMGASTAPEFKAISALVKNR